MEKTEKAEQTEDKINRQQAIELLRAYRQREAQIRLLRLETDALEQLPPTVPIAVYGDNTGGSAESSSSVEQIIQQREQKRTRLHRQSRQLEAVNHKIDSILNEIKEPYRMILDCRYIQQQTWHSVAKEYKGYSSEYLRKELNRKALSMFVGLW